MSHLPVDYSASATAYLIAICDPVTNAVLSAAIWSSPEWEQSRQLSEVRTYVAFARAYTTNHPERRQAPFHYAAVAMLEGFYYDYVFNQGYNSASRYVHGRPVRQHRYAHLIRFLRPYFKRYGVSPHPDMEFLDSPPESSTVNFTNRSETAQDAS